ncbi:gamma-glutamylcyclotransferase family protein [Vibrio sp. WXL103]|uniref:gamma-glutamylcyclotransferase family protein n=1 Tax=Vibrio sp. WXL103 TaxID=3450710 RepID=UPI003EC6F1A8
MDHLFVYGTLALGCPNEQVLNNIGGTWKKAFVTGRLHDSGWGAAMGYPGLELIDRGERIQGYLFSSPNLAKCWAELDAFEGDGYQRMLTTVELLTGEQRQAYVYVLKSV